MMKSRLSSERRTGYKTTAAKLIKRKEAAEVFETQLFG